MGRKLVSIQKIINIEEIKGADKIEVATILGWRVVVPKDEYHAGDLVCYYEADCFLPIEEQYEFLRKSCYKKFEDGREGFRIKTIRLKGQISQGLVMPLKIVEGRTSIEKYKFEEGSDITELLNVLIYNPPIPPQLMGEVKGQFPSFISKTDETRVQVLQNILTRNKGTICYITEKVDGASVTFFIKDGEFGVCSRNLELKETEGNAIWRMARKLDIENKLRKLNKNIAIQGEIIGAGLQGNPLQLNEIEVLFFNVFDIDKYCYYNGNDMFALLNEMDLDSVPILQTDFELIDNIDELIKLATKKSVINTKVWAEGIVIRPLVEKLDMAMAQGFGNGRLSFKAINPIYLIESEE